MRGDIVVEMKILRISRVSIPGGLPGIQILFNCSRYDSEGVKGKKDDPLQKLR